MNPIKRTAHIAGLIYLTVVVSGIFSLLYVPSQLIVCGNPSTTFNNIVANELLFRLGILAGVICYIAFLFLPIILCKLLSPVGKKYAVAMIALAVVSVPISLVNLSQKYSVLTLISKAEYLNVIQPDQLQAQVMLHLDYYNNGIDLVSVFWGLWLFPFGYLVFKSRFLPKILGFFLSSFVSLPASIGEIGTCLWLLIVGAKIKSNVHQINR